MKLKSFEELDCWKASYEVKEEVRMILKNFPTDEKFALTDNMRRASRSITANIAEGFGRFHYQENMQFCRISRGSLFELIDQYITAKNEEYISEEEYEKGRALLQKAIGLLNGYINYLNKAKKENQIRKTKTNL